MDKLKEASLNMKINELHNRMLEMHERAEEQLHLMEVFARHIEELAEELGNEKNSREG